MYPELGPSDRLWRRLLDGLGGDSRETREFALPFDSKIPQRPEASEFGILPISEILAFGGCLAIRRDVEEVRDRRRSISEAIFAGQFSPTNSSRTPIRNPHCPGGRGRNSVRLEVDSSSEAVARTEFGFENVEDVFRRPSSAG